MNSLYEEYMRSVLGFDTQNTYNMYSSDSIDQMNAMNNIQQQELENCYPDIYRIVYPMVQKACMNNTRMVNKELIDELKIMQEALNSSKPNFPRIKRVFAKVQNAIAGVATTITGVAIISEKLSELWSLIETFLAS